MRLPPRPAGLGRAGHRREAGAGCGMMASSAEFPTFTGKDRDLIRQEFMDHSGSATSIHNGFRIRRWVAGPNKGQPKVPVTVGSMLERGLVMIVDPGTG